MNERNGEALKAGTPVGHYWIEKVIRSDDTAFVYKAEDMRRNRAVLLAEYFPAGIAQRYVSPEGSYTLFTHPGRSEEFESLKQSWRESAERLRGIAHPFVVPVETVFEASDTCYRVSAVAPGIMLGERLAKGERFSEIQIGSFALQVVEGVKMLEARGIYLDRLDAASLFSGSDGRYCLDLSAVNEAAAASPGMMVSALGRLMYVMAAGCEPSEDEVCRLESGGRYSKALVGLINRMNAPEAHLRPATLDEVAALLASCRTNEETGQKPSACEIRNNPLASLTQLAVLIAIVCIGVYALFLREETTLENLSPINIAQFHVMAYFGNPDAKRTLGEIYEKGYGVDVDLKESRQWYHEAAEAGNLFAQMSLGRMHHEGIGVTRDDAVAAMWFQRAAQQGDATAQYNVGYFYAAGVGVNKNRSEAEKWLNLAAAQNSEAARDLLFSLERSDQEMTPRFDYSKERFVDAHKRALAGDAKAQYRLAQYYRNGNGVAKDEKKAFEWALKSAQNGYEYAYYTVGYAYRTGRGTETDLVNALRWYEKSAYSRKDAMSNYAVGRMHYYGYGTPLNYTLAYMWYEKAARQGNKSAEYAMGLMYELGRGVTRNFDEALRWYGKAAEHGHTLAPGKIKNIRERM